MKVRYENKDVVIKEYQYAYYGRDECDFLLKMKACTQLIDIYDSKEEQNKVYMVQEYVDGVSLESILRTRPTISPAYKKFIVG